MRNMIFKNMDGTLEAFPTHESDTSLLAVVREACAVDLPREFAALNFSVGIDHWMRAVFACNQYIDEQAPWTLRKTDPERMKAVLLTLFMAIRDLTIAIAPVVPGSAQRILDQLGIPADERTLTALADGGWYERRVATGAKLAQPVPAFPRLELPAEEAAD